MFSSRNGSVPVVFSESPLLLPWKVSGAPELWGQGSETALLRPFAGLKRFSGSSDSLGQGSETVLLHLLAGLGRFSGASECWWQGEGSESVVLRPFCPENPCHPIG